ncbi:MAG: zf-HC2 domain-containing protein [Planctomycetes bacterium]|nr:zf-HC2 domain-containing protein [Planctomycetota bacterium]
MNDPSQPEIDDELLSAYLDDELSAEERALVESHLATDPHSQQTLEQLRNVSQSVRDLPQESVGRDLRDSVLRRAQVAKLNTDPTASRAVLGPDSQAPTAGVAYPGPDARVAANDASLPTISIGRTRRGWVWASLAVAAAVLIMVFQPGREHDAKLPIIAQSKDESAAIDRQLAEHDSNLGAVNKPSPAAAAGKPSGAVASIPATPEPMPQGIADNRGAITPSTTTDAFGVNGRPESNELAGGQAAAMPEEKYIAPNGALTAPAAAAPQALDDSGNMDDGLVVVHVYAKRAALENKAFDQLLSKNGIALEQTAAAGDVSGDAAAEAESSSREPARVTSGRFAQEGVDEATKDDADVEMVLVDAPSSTIFSCMNDLNNDYANYVGVSVDDSSTRDEELAESPPTTELAADLGKFSRGIVPQQPADEVARDRYSYEAADDVRRFSGRLGFGGGVGGLSQLQKEASESLAVRNETDRGRARRIQFRASDGRQELERSANGTFFEVAPPADVKLQRKVEARPQLESLDKTKSTATANRDRLQVLFVLRPGDEPAPSLKAKNTTE